MANLAAVLKAEIVRLARREIKGELARMRKQVAAHRAALAKLKRQMAQVERLAAGQGRAASRSAAAPPNTSAAMRFSAKGLKTWRSKLGLSAADFGRLVGVSGNTVFNWEGEKARPQRAQLEALGALRGLGKRAAWAKLDEMA